MASIFHVSAVIDEVWLLKIRPTKAEDQQKRIREYFG